MLDMAIGIIVGAAIGESPAAIDLPVTKIRKVYLAKPVRTPSPGTTYGTLHGEKDDISLRSLSQNLICRGV